jgi:O-antigen/teichoic acid export membrane protein
MIMAPRGRSSGGASLAANTLGRLWTLVANLLMFPVYMRLLGHESFGIVALLAAVTAIIALFDLGLTPVLARELNNQSRDLTSKNDLLFTVEVAICAVVVLTLSAILLLPSEALLTLVNEHRSQTVQLDVALRLVFAVACTQLLFNFYVTAMSGMEAQVRANAAAMAVSLLRSVGVVLPLLAWPRVDVFLYWQLGATVIGILAVRQATYGLLRRPDGALRPRLAWREMRNFLPTAAAAFALSAAASLNMNIDKVFVGKQLGLSQIAEYSIVATFAQLIFIAIVPITITVTPRMVRLVTGNDHAGFGQLLSLTGSAIGIVTASLVTIFWWHGPRLIESWTGGGVHAAAAAGYSNWLFAGFAFLSISSIYHCVAVANRDFSFGRYYVFSVAVVLPLYWLMIERYGLQGAAIAWGLTQFAIMVFYVTWIHQRWLRPLAAQRHVILEALISAGCSAALCAGAVAAGLDRMGTLVLVLVVAFELLIGAALTHLGVLALARRLGFHSELSKLIDSRLRSILCRRQQA